MTTMFTGSFVISLFPSYSIQACDCPCLPVSGSEMSRRKILSEAESAPARTELAT